MNLKPYYYVFKTFMDGRSNTAFIKLPEAATNKKFGDMECLDWPVYINMSLKLNVIMTTFM